MPIEYPDIYLETCSMFPKREKTLNKLPVSGNDNKNEYYLCSTARQYSDMCGKHGKKYTFKDDKITLLNDLGQKAKLVPDQKASEK